MRLLIVTPFLPDPSAAHGGGSYVGTLCEALQHDAELGLVAQVRPDEMATLRSREWPYHYLAPVELGERPHGAQKLAHQVQMLFRWGACRQPLVAAKHDAPGMHFAIRKAIAEFRPDAALIELAQMAQYLPDFGSVPTILTDHEAGVPANTRTDLGEWADRRDRGLWRRYVQHYYPRATMLQAVTDEDAGELSRALAREVLVRPPTVHVPPHPVARIGTKPRVLFFGSYRHDPNPEAAAHVAREVLPRIRQKVPDAELWLAGPDCDRIAPLAGLPGVRVVGFREDLRALFADVRLVLTPMYSGGGFRMKSLTALAHGIPVVTNALGARGLVVPAKARVVAESDDDLAAAAVALLRDERLAAAAGNAAHAFAVANLAPAAIARLQVQRVRQLLTTRR
ncbi:MAG: glycosyltransferase [Planctomycetota bacterium]